MNGWQRNLRINDTETLPKKLLQRSRDAGPNTLCYHVTFTVNQPKKYNVGTRSKLNL